MDQSNDILIKKLSAPVEELRIEKWARRQLMRAGLFTVADVLLAGKQGLVSAGNIGPLSAEHIWRSLAGHLGLPEDLLLQVTPLPEEECLGLEGCAAPISALKLPQTTLSALKSMGLCWVRDLVKARPAAHSKFLGMSVKEIDEIQCALSHYLAQRAMARLPEFDRLTVIPGSQASEAGVNSAPDLSLPLPAISELDWSVIVYRAMQLSAIEQTVFHFGLSKGRLRRIFGRAHEHLRQKLIFLSLFLDHFDKKSEALCKDLDYGVLDMKTLCLHLLSEPALPDLPVDEEQVERLIVLIRSMVLQPSSWFKDQVKPRWPSLILMSCLVEPAVTSHEQVRQVLWRRKQEKKNKTSRELAYQVLTQTGKPMHFSAIADEVRLLGGQDFLKRSTFHKMLSSYTDLFSRIGPGIYALVEWGIQTPEFYPAIIASVLRHAKQPMPADWIQDQVSAIRPVRSSSLKMFLSLDVRFYKSIQNTYGLRAWLPEDAEQLPLPAWLVETPTSLLRVERARAQGIHVDKIISQDRPGPLETTTC